MEITFLGTGTSHGVPPLDCMMGAAAEFCRKGVCRKSETDPKHRRTRTSILLQKGGKTLIADVSMDFRQQALRSRVKNIDAVLLTHGHIDHFGGLPDIRSYTEEKTLDVYGSAETLDAASRAFQYMFDPRDLRCSDSPPRLRTVELCGVREIEGFTVTPVPVVHGRLKECLGFRIDDTGYVPDVKYMSPESEGLLRGLDCLILNCLRDVREHSTHMLLGKSMELARRLAPRKCYFIHMTHDIDYETDEKLLDPWMEFSYDGLIVNV